MLVDHVPRSSLPTMNVVVVGATGGIGWHSALAIARSAPDLQNLFLVGRNEVKGAAITKLCLDATAASQPRPTVTFFPVDLTEIPSVDAFADRIALLVPYINILVNAAGVIDGTPVPNKSGVEQSLVVNYLQRHRFCERLKSKLASCPGDFRSRVLIVAAPGIHWKVPIDWSGLKDSAGMNLSGLNMTRTAQKCNDVFVAEWSRRLKADGSRIDVFIYNPGLVATGLFDKQGFVTRMILKVCFAFRFRLSLSLSSNSSAPFIQSVTACFGEPLHKSGDAPAALVLDPSYSQKCGSSFKGRTEIFAPSEITDETVGRKLWDVADALMARK